RPSSCSTTIPHIASHSVQVRKWRVGMRSYTAAVPVRCPASLAVSGGKGRIASVHVVPGRRGGEGSADEPYMGVRLREVAPEATLVRVEVLRHQSQRGKLPRDVL